MDKKKVIGLIKKGMLYQSKSSHVSSYKEKAKNCFEEALGELKKSDWISVEDELPPYGEEVFVCNKVEEKKVWKAHRVEGKANYIDSHGFIKDNYYFSPTHWRRIDKLEV